MPIFAISPAFAGRPWLSTRKGERSRESSRQTTTLIGCEYVRPYMLVALMSRSTTSSTIAAPALDAASQSEIAAAQALTSGHLHLRSGLGIRIEHVERDRLAARLHDAHVLALELARVAHAAGVRDHVDLAVHVVGVVRDAQVFLLHHERALQPLVVRRHAGRAGVLVAAQRLDAAEREHEAARGVDEVGADAQRPCGARRGDQLARRNDAHALAQTRFNERIHY